MLVYLHYILGYFTEIVYFSAYCCKVSILRENHRERMGEGKEKYYFSSQVKLFLPWSVLLTLITLQDCLAHNRLSQGTTLTSDSAKPLPCVIYRLTLVDFPYVTLACDVYFLLPHARSHLSPSNCHKSPLCQKYVCCDRQADIPDVSCHLNCNIDIKLVGRNIWAAIKSDHPTIKLAAMKWNAQCWNLG